MISRCGLTCTECPAYVATQANDIPAAQKVAEAWSKAYNASITVDDVWCDGCMVEGRKCSHCAECGIRACAMGKDHANCGHCPDYACDQLKAFMGMVPHVKPMLEGIRATLA